LAAGEILRLRVISGNSTGWSVRIGCHSDSLIKKSEWKRYPKISKTEGLSGQRTSLDITSPFGGLIYLVSSDKTKSATIVVELRNVVEAAFFNLSDTRRNINLQASAPMAEIQGRHLTMSLPLQSLSKVNNFQEIAEYWDLIVERAHELRGSLIDFKNKPTKYTYFVMQYLKKKIDYSL
jgi:hypothetical protein